MNPVPSPSIVALAMISVGVSTACTSVDKVDEISRGDEARTANEEPAVVTRDASVIDASTAAEPEPNPTPTMEPVTTSIGMPTPAMEPTAAPEQTASEPGQAPKEPMVLPEGPPSEPSTIDNTGVWITGGGLAARGTGAEWEYYLTSQPYNGGIWGIYKDEVWFVGTTVARFAENEVVLDPTYAPWSDVRRSLAYSLVSELWGTSDTDLWGVLIAGDVYVHFDGRGWSETSLATAPPERRWAREALPGDPPITGYAAGEVNDLWVVTHGTFTPASSSSLETEGPLAPYYRGYVFHYDGTEWRDVTPPRLGECLEEPQPDYDPCSGESRRLGKVWIAPERKALNGVDAGATP